MATQTPVATVHADLLELDHWTHWLEINFTLITFSHIHLNKFQIHYPEVVPLVRFTVVY